MRCGKCGSVINNDYTMCSNCGNNLDEDRIEQILDDNKDLSISKILMVVIIVLLLIVSIYYIIVGLHNDLTVVGKWKCADYSEDINPSDDDIYYFYFEFKEDNSFKQYNINKDKNDFLVTGAYSEELLEKTSEDMYGFLDVYLGIKSTTKNGVTDNKEITSHYEFDILKNRSSALVINTQNYSAYYCERD